MLSLNVYKFVCCLLVNNSCSHLHMSDIGVSLVKIQDDLNKLKLALQRGTHNDGTPIDITAIEVYMELLTEFKLRQK